MQRRTFIQLLPAALGACTLPIGAITFIGYTPEPPRFSRKEIESAVRGFFTPELLRKNKFDWNAHWVNDLGLDSLDTVELVLHCEQQLNTLIPDDVAEKIISPRQLVDALMRGLNNAIVLYEKPDFKGTYMLLFSTEGVPGKVKLGKSKGFDSIYSVVTPGSVYKPKGYELTLNGKALGSKAKVWEDARFAKRLGDGVGDVLEYGR